MRRISGSLAALFISSIVLVSSGHGQSTRTRIFRSAEVLSASDIRIPFNSVANGMVELYLTISDTGTVEDVRVARPLASVTEEAVRAVKSWKFAPASMYGKPVESQLTVCVVFCPMALLTTEMPLSPLEPDSRQAATGTLPPVSPEVIEAKYPSDGNARSVGGTVVLRVLVGAEGQPGLVRVVKDAPTMTDSAEAGVAHWRFSPAQLTGKPAISGIVIAFVFCVPLVNSY